MVENLDEWINSKKYTMQDITDMIGSKEIAPLYSPYHANTS